MTQALLFPDPRPLVERLGAPFFRQLPEAPGVYLMRDAGDFVLYVGKAKNLRKRLGNYRVANPDRLPRRHLRLLRAVVRIELELCADETSALLREAELLRTLRPRFNRAGTWPGKPRFLTWCCQEDQVAFAISEIPREGWETIGPAGGGVDSLRGALVRLLWCTAHPEQGIVGMPPGWARGRLGGEAKMNCASLREELPARLTRLSLGNAAEFCDWVRSRMPSDAHPFNRAVLEADLEFVAKFFD